MEGHPRSLRSVPGGGDSSASSSKVETMKFPFQCNTCTSRNPAEYSDDNTYRFNCHHCGETNLATIRKEKFELLFDFGSLAFLDGYYREAVANFATSLERFFEFWVRTIRHKHSIGDDPFDKTWKLMSKQSERQIGAFAVLYLLNTGQAPRFLDSNRLRVKFRNDVVHAGKIPTRKETVMYADLVYDLIRRLLIELHNIAPSLVDRDLENDNAEVVNEAHANDYQFLQYDFPGMLGTYRFSPETIARDKQKYQEYQEIGDMGSRTGDREYLRIDLGFEDTLAARRWILEQQVAGKA